MDVAVMVVDWDGAVRKGMSGARYYGGNHSFALLATPRQSTRAIISTTITAKRPSDILRVTSVSLSICVASYSGCCARPFRGEPRDSISAALCELLEFRAMHLMSPLPETTRT